MAGHVGVVLACIIPPLTSKLLGRKRGREANVPTAKVELEALLHYNFAGQGNPSVLCESAPWSEGRQPGGYFAPVIENFVPLRQFPVNKNVAAVPDAQ
jgi:hypothetical protein